MNSKQTNKYTPEWARRAKSIPHKPEWVDFIPHELWDLGDVFFPIPRRKKSNRWAFHKKDKRFSADDEILNAYLESGSGYGIVCAGDLSVLDIDDMDYRDEIIDRLPDTMFQVTGSRVGEHHFFYCPDMDSRIVLYDQFLGEKIHIGEFKCDTHEYVVGPKSVHPSGNKYGPLQGNEIVEVSEEDIRGALDEYIVEETVNYPQSRSSWDVSEKDCNEFYKLSTDDVLPWLEEGKNIAHPVHGSTTGQNFRKSDERDVFICWRCDYGSGVGCALNANQFLAAEETGMSCDQIRSGWKNNYVLHYKSWKRAYEIDLVGIDFNHLYYDVPLNVLKGYADIKGLSFEDNNRWDLLNAFVYEHIYYPP